MNREIFTHARIKHHANPANSTEARRYDYPSSLQRHFSLAATAEAVREISTWHGYQPTALHSLNKIASEFGLAAIYYKDESTRFGLGSFKALGGAYAVLRLLQKKIFQQSDKHVTAHDIEHKKLGAPKELSELSKLIHNTTVVTATDGNHGRSVAWGARRFGCRCRIYIHAGVSERRAAAMQELGAEVIRITGNYDDSVREAARDAQENDWHVVSDTSYPGYTELPSLVMAGYSVMLDEVMQQLPKLLPKVAAEKRLTHVFVQGGVGGLAASVAAYLWEKLGNQAPHFIVVEPELADCLFQSGLNQSATEVHISTETIMAGLSCGEVSQLAWEVLAPATDHFITITDELVAPVMRMLAHTEPSIEAGESAVAGLAGCLAACVNPQLKTALGLNENSQVLVLGTEGATDGEIYQQIVNA